MKHLRQYIRDILLENAFDFAKELGSRQKSGEMEAKKSGIDLRRSTRGKIKDLFRRHADHKWLSQLVTVHWTSRLENLPPLARKYKDELSASMSLPGEPLASHAYGTYGLWIEGHITIAASDMDDIASGHMSDYRPNRNSEGYYSSPSAPSKEKYDQQKKSSGINKQPTQLDRYTKFAGMKDETKDRKIFNDKYLETFPYILGPESWKTPGHQPNEALVDNWRPKGIIISSTRRANSIREAFSSGDAEKIFNVKSMEEVQTAQMMKLPLFDSNLQIIMYPGE